MALSRLKIELSLPGGPADRTWLGLFVAVTVYELYAALRDVELLSEAADRYRGRHPILVHSAVVYLAAHLIRRVPARIDPLHRLAVSLRR